MLKGNCTPVLRADYVYTIPADPSEDDEASDSSSPTTESKTSIMPASSTEISTIDGDKSIILTINLDAVSSSGLGYSTDLVQDQSADFVTKVLDSGTPEKSHIHLSLLQENAKTVAAKADLCFDRSCYPLKNEKLSMWCK